MNISEFVHHLFLKFIAWFYQTFFCIKRSVGNFFKPVVAWKQVKDPSIERAPSLISSQSDESPEDPASSQEVATSSVCCKKDEGPKEPRKPDPDEWYEYAVNRSPQHACFTVAVQGARLAYGVSK